MKKLFLIVTMLITLITPAVALAAPQKNPPPPPPGPTDSAKQQVCTGINGAITGADCNGNSAQKTVSSIMKAVLNILSWVAGIAAVIMVVIAGLKYITSRGDSSAIASAKSSLIYALVGIIIVAIAQTIVFFALHAAKVG